MLNSEILPRTRTLSSTLCTYESLAELPALCLVSRKDFSSQYCLARAPVLLVALCLHELADNRPLMVATVPLDILAPICRQNGKSVFLSSQSLRLAVTLIVYTARVRVAPRPRLRQVRLPRLTSLRRPAGLDPRVLQAPNVQCSILPPVPVNPAASLKGQRWAISFDIAIISLLYPALLHVGVPTRLITNCLQDYTNCDRRRGNSDIRSPDE
jgi:hypothetical protein